MIMAKDRADESAQHPICRQASVSYSAIRTNRRKHTKFGAPKDKGNSSQPSRPNTCQRTRGQMGCSRSIQAAARRSSNCGNPSHPGIHTSHPP